MKNNDYTILVNDTSRFDVNVKTLEHLDIIKNTDGSFHCLSNNKKFNIVVLDFNANAKTMTLKINGNPYKVQIKDQFDILIDKMGLVGAETVDIKEIYAPMPGLVLDIQVEVNSQVKKGDTLLVLEAMKMENMIKSPIDGSIKQMHVNAGDPVDKGQLLIEFY